MDSERFDAVARTLGRATSRRGAVGLLAAAAGLGLDRAAAARKPRRAQAADPGPFCAGKPNGTVCAGGKPEDTRRCCGGKCDPPKCRPAFSPCGERGCLASCCTEFVSCDPRRDPPCVCGQSDPRGDSACGSDGDCFGSICVCGRCCVASGQRTEFGCSRCCTGRCESGDVCA